MRKITAVLMFSLVFFVINSCSKHDDEEIVDCFGDSIFIKLTHSVDASDSKKINYSIEYTGSRTLSSVKWTFGDGSTGTGTSISHTYAAAGTFEVKADVTTKNGNAECTSSPKKSITVN
ncbi:PKD domain-containing protein [Flavobacterium defluvii]|uniref:PKD domain-containing protein n=1 Tax=Flavobacterium defluvii TaxID=370979 RepID=A0A1M5LF56_9FLAO|nr:PKD domain-containing protein [Flavobacterium defluvii]SHG63013.1 PKD domain-containing protein [Flavobacterium defluvii]